MSIGNEQQREVASHGRPSSGWRAAAHKSDRQPETHRRGPLQWAVLVVRELLYRVRLAIEAPPVDVAEGRESERINRDRHLLAEEYSRGYMAGWRECFETCLETVEDEIARTGDVWSMGMTVTGSPKVGQGN